METPRFDYDELMNCMRCGFCLPTCPTYIETGKETASPRGRIALMKGTADGMLPLAAIEEQMNLCLGCLNCVTACPAGVQFGRLLEDAREAVAETKPLSAAERLLYDGLLPRPWLLTIVAALLWLYQASGLQRLAHALGVTKVLPGPVRDMEKILPKVSAPWRRRLRARKAVPAAKQGAGPDAEPDAEPGAPGLMPPPGADAMQDAGPDAEPDAGPDAEPDAEPGAPGLMPPPGADAPDAPRRISPPGVDDRSDPPRIGFFVGCVMDMLFSDVNDDSMHLLSDAGCDVRVLTKQTCCGALHAHGGHEEQAKQLARRNIEAFEQGGYDLLVNSIGGCGAALKEYGHWLRDDPKWRERARAFSARVRDLSEVLTERGYAASLSAVTEDSARGVSGSFGGSDFGTVVTMQPSCHLVHGQGVRDEPWQLLHATGANVCEMKDGDRCCGSAGIYNLTQPAMADRVLERKMASIKETGADVIVTTNPGCHLQLLLGVERAGLGDKVRVVPLARFLREL